MIDFIRQHSDDYDAGMAEEFAKLVDKLDPPATQSLSNRSLARSNGPMGDPPALPGWQWKFDISGSSHLRFG